MPFAVLFLVVVGVLVLAFIGLGVSIWAGRRKTIGTCSCDFDPDRARAKKERGCCGDGCGGGHAHEAPPSARRRAG